MGGFFREVLAKLLIRNKIDGSEIFLDSEHNFLHNLGQPFG